MVAGEFSLEAGSPQQLTAGAGLYSVPLWPQSAHAANQDIAPNHSSYGYETGTVTGRGERLADDDYIYVLCRNICVVTATLLLLAFFQFTPPNRLSNFYARKLTHISMGTCLLASQPVGHIYMQLSLVAVGVSAIVSCFVKPFRFSEKRDRGIILYNIIVCTWVILDLPLTALGPMFYADPCGAIAGTLFRTPTWIRNKTVAGSAAVFVVTFLTAFSATSLTHRLILAAICCLLEAVGGRYDNAFIAVPLSIYYFVFHNQ